MVKNHVHYAFEPKYLMDYKVFRILNERTLLHMTPNGMGRKINVNIVKPYSTTELVENAWDSILSSIKTRCQTFCYN